MNISNFPDMLVGDIYCGDLPRKPRIFIDRGAWTFSYSLSYAGMCAAANVFCAKRNINERRGIFTYNEEW